MPTDIVNIGLVYGDEGKGTKVDHDCRVHGVEWVWRFGGGCNAAHNADTPDGRHVYYRQFGSGTMAGAKTYHSKYMLIDPLSLEAEAENLEALGVEKPLSRIFINEECLITTPFHKHLNRLRESLRGENRHGSVGRGIGETVRDGQLLGQEALRIKDLLYRSLLREKVERLWQMKVAEAKELLKAVKLTPELAEITDFLFHSEYPEKLYDDYCAFTQTDISIVDHNFAQRLLASEPRIVFEGTQGGLLDVDYGFWPYVTKTRTTAHNALELLNGRSGERQVIINGIIRAQTTRHGKGPLVTESQELTQQIPDVNNDHNPWQGDFRIGWLDLLAVRYGIACNELVDTLTVTNLDRFDGFAKIKVYCSYEYLGAERELVEKYFHTERQLSGRVIIHDFRQPKILPICEREELTSLLFDCQPYEYQEFDGWKQAIARQAQVPLPDEARRYIEFIEQAVGLPITLVSVGPRATDKIKLK